MIAYTKSIDNNTFWEDPSDAPAFMSFYKYEMNGYQTVRYSKTRILTIHSTVRKFMTKISVMERLHAKLILRHPECRIGVTGICRTEETKSRNEFIVRRTTCRSMVTKISNKIAAYERHQKTLLLPDYDNKKYLKLKEKLENYKNELKELEDA